MTSTGWKDLLDEPPASFTLTNVYCNWLPLSEALRLCLDVYCLGDTSCSFLVGVLAADDTPVKFILTLSLLAVGGCTVCVVDAEYCAARVRLPLCLAVGVLSPDSIVP